MIALRLPLLRPLRLLPWRLPPRLRAALPAVAWSCRWLGLGLALGALTDLVVRLAA
jgi:hypothetical protein